MQDLQRLTVEAGAAAARYSLQLQSLIEASGASMRSAHHGSGTELYHRLNYAPDDLHEAADALDAAGRELIFALMKMKRLAEYGEQYKFVVVGPCLIRRMGTDQTDTHTYYGRKEEQHPSEWTTPFDWMLLVSELPAILAQLAAAPAAA